MSHEPSVASPVKGIQDRIRIQFRMFLLWFVSPNIKSVSRQAGRYRQHQCLMRLDPVSGSFGGDIHIFSGTPRHKNAMISHHIAVKQTLEEELHTKPNCAKHILKMGSLANINQCEVLSLPCL